jgi:ribosomal protein S27AE
MKDFVPIVRIYENRQECYGFFNAMVQEERRLSAQMNEIKRRLDIEKLIGQRTGLKRVRGQLKGMCFRCGRSSFMISLNKDEFHCTKCHIRGDIVDYVAQVKCMSIEIAAQILETFGYLLKHNKNKRIVSESLGKTSRIQ